MRNKIQQIRVMKNRIFKWAIKYMWNLTIIAGRVGIYPWKLTNLFDPITHSPVHEHLFGWIRIYFFRFFRFRAGNGLPFFCRVTTWPARHILKLNPNPNSPNPTQLHLTFLSHIFYRLSFSLSSVASLAPPSPCLPHSHASLTPSWHHFLTASLRQSLASRPTLSIFYSRTASPSGPSLPSWPHPVRSLAFLTASLVQIHASIQIWFVVLIFFFRLDFCVVLIWFYVRFFVLIWFFRLDFFKILSLNVWWCILDHPIRPIRPPLWMVNRL